MKSINYILSFLFLSSTLSFVAFAQSFTYENPIVLPTTSHDNDVVHPEVYDQKGDPLRIGDRYIINNPLLGGGSVYLDNVGNLKCPNAVLQHMSFPPFLGEGTPIMFVRKSDYGDVVRVLTDVYIKFFVKTTRFCVKETVWKVNDEGLVVTGGNLGDENDIFKIMKTDLVIRGMKNVYKLLHCPSHQLCKNIGGNFKNGYPRLATVDNDKDFIPFVFIKA